MLISANGHGYRWLKAPECCRQTATMWLAVPLSETPHPSSLLASDHAVVVDKERHGRY